MAVYEKENETITAQEFMDALADDDFEKVHLEKCMIVGDVDIEDIFPGRTRPVIRKQVRCKHCRFQGRVNFRRAVFPQDIDFGDTTFEGSASHQQSVNFRETEFKGNADFRTTRFKERADFRRVKFSKNADFRKAQFGCNSKAHFSFSQFRGYVYFHETQFWSGVDFQFVEFRGDVVFNKTTFYVEAKFYSSTFFRPAIFIFPDYQPDTFLQCFHSQKPTEFFLDDQNVDAVRNPRFKRYIADQQYIRAFKEAHPVLAEIWRWSSDYGRSFGLWAFWSVMIALFFGCAYAHELWDFEQVLILTGGLYISFVIIFGLVTETPFVKWLHWVWFYCRRRKWLWGLLAVLMLALLVVTVKDLSIVESADTPRTEPPNFLTYLYFSVVTFTTLGFGDITPQNNISEIWLMAEVILGFIMLGGLISIFANKLARRS